MLPIQILKASKLCMLPNPWGSFKPQSRYYIQTLGPKVGTISILGALGNESYPGTALARKNKLCWVSPRSAGPRRDSGVL